MSVQGLLRSDNQVGDLRKYSSGSNVDRGDAMAHNGTTYQTDARQSVADQADHESQALLGSRRKSTTPTGIIGVLLILLLGEIEQYILVVTHELMARYPVEFIASADTTLIFASGATMASEFKSFDKISWLSTAYTMGVCTFQPTLGKLSDIYGRKPILLVSCLFFAAGCLLCAFGVSMDQVIVGRAVTGIGGGGLMSMASLIIADVVDVRELAVWRSYDNVSQTLGRSLGGPLGGLLTDTIGWRWLFHIQVPVILAAALLALWKLRLPKNTTSGDLDSPPAFKGLRRIDFLGATTFAGFMISTMLLSESSGKNTHWSPLTIWGFATLSIGLLIGFILVEAFVASEPIFHLRLLTKKDVVLSYGIMAMQILAQFTLMFTVPLYFQITQRSSPTVAGLHLMPAVIGNAVGGLLAGAWIKRTGRFKSTAVCAGLIASSTYVLLLFRWKSHTGPWESLYIIPGGFGTSLVLTAMFVSMTAAVSHDELAMCTSGFFLVMHLAMLASMTVSNSVISSGFRSELEKRVQNSDAQEIIEKAIADTSYIDRLPTPLHEVVTLCYALALHRTYWISLTASISSSFIAIFLTNRQL